MKPIVHRLCQLLSLLAVPVVLLGLQLITAPALAAVPAHTVLPAATCAASGSTRSCALYARSGNFTLPGATVEIWGFTDAAAGPATLPGPAIIAKQGETLQITLHNDLSEPVSLRFSGQSLLPDLTGAPPGGTVVYTFTASQAGTFLYEAGLTPDGPRQVAMGLFGPLIVRPEQVNQAYADPNTAYDDEALVILSEIDPAFNANPAAFTLADFSPKYWLLNGQVYPDTANIVTAPGHRVLLRYVNAGLHDHAMGILGLGQVVLATDGWPLRYQYRIVSETMPAGGTLDTIAEVPRSQLGGDFFALYDTAMRLDNAGSRNPDGQPAFGGPMTFLSTPDVPRPNSGPLTSNVQITPALTNGPTVALSATLSSSVSTVAAAEYYIDTPGVAGSGVISGTYGAASVKVSLAGISIAGLADGPHIVYVRGLDAANVWGALAFVILRIDRSGPVISAPGLNRLATNGTSALAIQAQASDSAGGNLDVTAGEYFIDLQGENGSGQTLTLNRTAGEVNLSGFLAANRADILDEGTHHLLIHAEDALGNWGPAVALPFAIDKTAPATTDVSAASVPISGTQPIDGSPPAVMVTAAAGDPLSGGINTRIEAMEGFVDILGAPGAGQALIPNNGAYGAAVESGYFLISSDDVRQLTPGIHTIYVRARDAAGNWGETATGQLIVDQTRPPAVDTGTQSDSSTPPEPPAPERKNKLPDDEHREPEEPRAGHDGS